MIFISKTRFVIDVFDCVHYNITLQAGLVLFKTDLPHDRKYTAFFSIIVKFNFNFSIFSVCLAVSKGI